MGNKPYQPDRFTQVLSPVEAVNAENERLKHLVIMHSHFFYQSSCFHKEEIRLQWQKVFKI
jgi:hypothetical protein